MSTNVEIHIIINGKDVCVRTCQEEDRNKSLDHKNHKGVKSPEITIPRGGKRPPYFFLDPPSGGSEEEGPEGSQGMENI